VLLLSGVFVNLLPFPLFFNIDILFGSIFALLILRLYGTVWGAIAASCISLPTSVLWHHPFAILIMTIEVWVTGWLCNRYRLSLLFANTLYWLVCGMGLAYGALNYVMVMTNSSTIIMIKLAINGIGNALIADFLFYCWLSFRSREKLVFQQISANLLAALALLPALIFFIFTARQDYAEAEQASHLEVMNHSLQLERAFDRWLHDQMTSLDRLAALEGELPHLDQQLAMQHMLSINQHFSRIALFDENKHLLLSKPTGERDLQQGNNFTFSPGHAPLTTAYCFHPQAKERDALEKPSPPKVFCIAPLSKNERQQGYLTAQLNLEGIPPIFTNICSKELYFTLLDQHNRVIASNWPQLYPQEIFNRGPGHTEKSPDGFLLWIPDAPANSPYSERWPHALFFRQVPISTVEGWSLLVEKPMNSLQNRLYFQYTAKFTLLFITVLVCLIASAYFNRRVTAAITQLENWTGEMANQIPKTTPQTTAPNSRWLEVSTLIDHFANMAAELRLQFIKIQQMNLSLEQKVFERTQSLQASHDLLLHLTDAVPVGIFQADSQGRCIFINDRFAQITGLTHKAHLGKGWFTALHPEDRERVVQDWKKNIAAHRAFFSSEFRLLTPKGQIRWAQSITKRIDIKTQEGPCYIGCLLDLTEQKESEIALREHSTNLSNLVETTNDLVVVTNLSGSVLFWNQTVLNALGYSKEEFFGLQLCNLYREKDAKILSKELADLRQGQQFENRLPLKTAAGDTFPVSARLSLGRWNGADCLFLFYKDLRLEDEARRLFQRLFHNNPALMVLTSLPDRLLVDVNSAFERTLGYSRDEVIGKTTVELGLFVHPHQQQAILKQVYERKNIHGMMLQIRSKDGIVVEGLFSGENIISQGKEYWLSVMVDVTPWRLAQQALHRRESYLSAIIESLPGLVWLKDENSRFLTVNATFAQSCGKKLPEKVEGKFDEDVWPEKLATAYRKDDQKVLTTGKPLMLEEEIFDHGKNKWFETFKAPVWDKRGKIIGTVGYARDITERRQAELALKESRERLLTATSAAQLGIFSYDFTSGEIYHSPQFLVLFGLPPESQLERDADLLPKALHPDDRETLLAKFDAVNTPGSGGILDHEFRIYRPDGTLRWLRLVGRTVFSKAIPPRPLRANGILQDLSERKEMEEALKTSQNQALAANAEKTQLLSTVAHEFRTPLSLMSSSLDILDRYGFRLSPKQRTTQKQHLRSGLNQLKHLIDTALTFNRSESIPSQSAAESIQLSKLLTTICQEMQLTWSREHEFRVEISPQLSSIKVEPHLFRRIIENLLTNAFFYTPSEGKIHFLATKQGETLHIQVKDTGMGIADQDRSRIFTSFYRGENVGSTRGMGLGLHIVQTAVQQMGGKIFFRSKLHKGTTFIIDLPLPLKNHGAYEPGHN